MRLALLIATLFFAFVCGCSRGPSVEYSSLLDARKAINTNLTKKGPAPDAEWEPEDPPQGVSEVEFKSGELKLRGWLAVPAGRTNCPALVFAHGGFSFGGGDFEQVEPWVSKGWVVFVPMLRGENGCPGSYDLFVGEVDDLIAAGKFVAAMTEVDPKTVFIAGHSVGGTRAVLAAMLPGPFRAAAGIGAATDVEEWLDGQEELAPFDPSDNDELYLRSPKYHVKSLAIPLILVRGRNELWNKHMTKKFVTEAKAQGKDVSTVEVPGDHFTAIDEGLKHVFGAFTTIASR